MSKLYFRYGAMNCGKSAALMQVAYNYESNNKRVFVIKSEIDTKGDNFLESRIGLRRKVDLLLKKNESLEKYYDEIKKVDCILIDEAQFLEEKTVDELFYIAKRFNVPVICYGLKTNFQGRLFDGSKRIIELADELEELITICKCGKRAKFNGRYVNGTFTIDGDVVKIDGKDETIEYIPLCGKCYLEEKEKRMF